MFCGVWNNCDYLVYIICFYSIDDIFSDCLRY